MPIANPPFVVITAEDRQIIITAEDQKRLIQWLNREVREIVGYRKHLDDLLHEVHRASAVEPTEVPGDIVKIGLCR